MNESEFVNRFLKIDDSKGSTSVYQEIMKKNEDQTLEKMNSIARYLAIEKNNRDNIFFMSLAGLAKDSIDSLTSMVHEIMSPSVTTLVQFVDILEKRRRPLYIGVMLLFFVFLVTILSL